MFPNAPADALFWDFIDIVGNQTAPKSIYLRSSATRKPYQRIGYTYGYIHFWRVRPQIAQLVQGRVAENYCTHVLNDIQ